MQVKTNKHIYKIIDSDYTLDVLNDEVILVNPTSDVTITIPEASTLPLNYVVNEYRIKRTEANSNKVAIKLSGSDTFPLGHTTVYLSSPSDTFLLGGICNGKWNNLSNIDVWEKSYRGTDWDDSNFSNETAVPFDSVEFEDNTDILEWDSTGKTKVTCKITTRLYVSYSLSIDSTGGGTWVVNSYLRKNGTTHIDGSNVRTGNYGGEDQSGALPTIPIDVQAGDYLELTLDHDNLSGKLVNAYFIIRTTI